MYIDLIKININKLSKHAKQELTSFIINFYPKIKKIDLLKIIILLWLF